MRKQNNNTIKERLIVIEHVLMGNGSEGLFDIVKEIRKQQEKQNNEIKRLQMYLYIGMGGVGIVYFSLEVIIKHFVK